MCGIVCYVGKKEAKPILIEGLKRLEYRGYDSAGIAVENGSSVCLRRSVGRISELERKINGQVIAGQCGIAHTRWATHGEPTETNAHPHKDQDDNVYIIHNGIIENFRILKKKLEKEGIRFRSQTDTEVLAHLIARNFDGDLSEAVRKTMGQVEGTFGIAVLHKQVPGEVVVARRGSPLVIGVGEEENFAASDVSALVRYTNRVIHLQDNELATLYASDVKISTMHAKRVQRPTEEVEWSPEDAELNGFPHFMLKEIYEQSETIQNAVRGRLEAGEMKHGPIALVSSQLPTVAIVPFDEMYEKMLNNIHEIKSRKGPVIAIATEGDQKLRDMVDEVIEIPETLDFLTPVLAVVPCQLLAYYSARFLGREIDKPRNLAKSVTVE
jgi:glucosamine--fructose-6-phosphate aminotransferase (isomerizing)